MTDSKHKDRPSLSLSRYKDSKGSKSKTSIHPNNQNQSSNQKKSNNHSNLTNTQKSAISPAASNTNLTTQSSSSVSASTFSTISNSPSTETQTEAQTQAQAEAKTQTRSHTQPQTQTYTQVYAQTPLPNLPIQQKRLPIENPIISIIFDRIDFLLPYKSGFSVMQILSDPYYIQAKTHLLKLSTASRFTKDLIACIYNILSQIIEKDPAKALADRNPLILNSIYLLVSLLSSFLDVIKSRETLNHSSSKLLRSTGLKTTHFIYKSHIPSMQTTILDNDLSLKLLKLLISLKNDSTCLTTLFSITEPPNISVSNPFINPTSQSLNLTSCSNLNIYYHNSFLATSLIDPNSPSSVKLATTKSATKMTPSGSISIKMSTSNSTSTKTSISDSSNQNSNLKLSSIPSNSSSSSNSMSEVKQDNHSTSHSISDYNEVKQILTNKTSLKGYDIINLIDESISSVLFNIASTNPSQYLSFEKLFFRYINVDSLYVKGSHLVQFAFLSSTTFNANIQFVREIFHITKRDSQKSLLLHFFAESILAWALHRTEDFIKALDMPLCCKNSEVFFDTIYREMDPFYSPRVYYSILSCLLFFQPKQLIKFMNEKSSKSTTQALKRSLTSVAKLSSNKQKILSEFTQLITKSPEYAQPVLLFLLVGCSIGSFDKTHPLYIFVEFMDEPLTKKLKLDKFENFKAYTESNYPTKSAFSPTFDVTNTSTSSTASSNISSSPTPTDTSNNSSQHLTSVSNSIPNSLPSVTTTTTNDNNLSAHQNSKIFYELKVGVFAISSIVNQFTLIDKIISSLNTNRTSMQLLPLFTGSFRMLILLPSLSNVIVGFIEKLSSSFSKILSLLCDQILLTNRQTLASIHKSPPLSPVPRRNSLLLSSPKINRSNSDASRYPSDINKQRLRPIMTGNPIDNSVFRTSPLRLTNDDSISSNSNKADEISINTSNSEEWGNFEKDILPFVKLTTDSNDIIHDPINYNLIKSQLPKCSYQLLKKNIINLLTIYSSYPFLLFPDIQSNGKHAPRFDLFQKIFKKFINKVANLLYLDDDEIFAATETFLLSFCVSVSNVIPLRVFMGYISTSMMIDSVSAVGISSNIANSKRDKIIKLILILLEKRAEHTDLELMYEHRHIADQLHASASCHKMIKNFEYVVFMGMFSNNIETIRISKRLLQFYTFMMTNRFHLPDCFDLSNSELMNNLLADKMNFGLASTRKKIRDHLCQLKKPNDTLADIWNLMYEKVALTYNYKDVPNINAPSETIGKSHQDIENIEIYSEYLASLGGILMSSEFDDNIRQQDLRNKLEIFITNKFMNLFSNEVKKREQAREILSVSIHPYLSPIIMAQIKAVLPRIEANFKLKEFNICELYMSVLKSICQIDTELLFSLAVDLWKVNFKLLTIFNVDSNDMDFLRIKLKFCKLQVIFLEKLGGLSFNGNILRKNEYARIAASYLENTFEVETEDDSDSKVLSFNTKKASSRYKALKDSEYKELQIDIRVEASNMLRLILYKLPLDTLKNSFDSPEDGKNAASVMFSNYFNLFVKTLEKMNESKSDKDLFPAIHHRISSVITEVIQGLINLLKGNPEIGLKYSLPLGYNNDELIRISFIDVFSKIIKDVHTTTEREISKSAIFKEGFEHFITDIDFFLSAASCCQKSDIEAYALALLQLPISERKKLELFLALIKYDVLHTSEKNEILRSNTVGTRVTALYSYDNATKYLIAIFRPIFQHMIITQEFFEIEKIVDEDEETIERNIKLFLKYLNMIADGISNSLSLLPIGIRLIAKTIYDSTIQILPDSKFSSINAYLFLRLINPTIVAPERLNIVEFSDTRFKRSLILLARVIQSIVNEAPVRIPVLESRSDDLSYARKRFFSFMEEVVSCDYNEVLESIPENYATVAADAQFGTTFAYFHQYFYRNWMEIRETYDNQSFTSKDTKEKKEILIRSNDALLLRCGLPLKIKDYEIPDNIKNDKSPKGLLLYDFLSRTTLTLENTSFIKVLITRDGLPLICVNTLEFPEGITTENYSFAMLQTLSKFWATPFCLLMDLTSFDNFSLYEKNRELLFSIVPSYYKVNCKRIYYVNMTSDFYVNFKNLNFDHSAEDVLIDPELVFISTNDDSKTMSKNKLIGYDNAVSHDPRVLFCEVSIFQELSNRFVPVKLQIGDQFLQVSFASPERMKLGSRMCVINLVDCYKVNELSEIVPSSFTGVANELSMINLRTEKRLIFTSTKKIEIMRTLYFLKARLNTNPYAEDDYSAVSNPQFVVGQLLSTSFAGLLAKSAEIRKSSYSLLHSLALSMGLKTGKAIDCIDSVTFPYGGIDYVSDISATIAKSHPNLTYSFLYGFFSAFEKLESEDQNLLILCVSPWIKNIHKNVYLSDPIKGPNKTTDIIRKFIRASRQPKNFQVFSMFVWPQLSLEDGLIEIIIDEIVAAATDHDNEEHDWANFTKYWPLRSSVEICSVIIKKMKEKSYSMPISESQMPHTRWIEITVLAKFLSYLVFDSLLFVDKYISDIFYLVTIYMDSGPKELRRCLLNLVTRAYHSYLSNPSLSDEQYTFIKDQIKLLNGPRFRVIFGLARDDDQFSAPHKILGSEVSNKANSVTVLCEVLMSFLEKSEEYALQMVKWNSSVRKIAFDDDSQLQCRAILVLGALSNRGVSGDIVFRFMDLLKFHATKYVYSTPDEVAHNISLFICTLHGFSKTILGIDNSSAFHPLIFWCHIIIALTGDVAIFSYGIRFLKSTLVSIYEYTKSRNIKLVDYLFDHQIEAFLKAEETYNFRLTKENFDAILVLICCKGLESPLTYSETIISLKDILKIRYEEHLRYPDDERNEYYCYLFFEFLLSGTNVELKATLEECGLKDIEYVYDVNDCKIPRLLLDWFDRQTLNVYSVCSGATNYFMKQKLDESASTRVVSLYVELFKQNSKVVLKLFRQIDGILKKFVASSATPGLLEKVLDMIVSLLRNPEYFTHQMSETEWLQMLEDNNMKGVTNFTFMPNTLFAESSSVVSLEDRQKRLVFFNDILTETAQNYKEELDKN